ncbi:17852_t:CDS:2 [Cetraspora pellucida]|uniref:17852_t:CDS:1 n=1 Tax=Cetraspora pellucida TaxID=1433469 RepID=A0ACA9LH14_9GLOM|nr:17852_t:CDS:2 [Cetraspora pellucida]
MCTHSPQNESDYVPKNHTIFSSYSLNPFRSENNFHTPVNFVNSNTETITDQINNTRIQYTTLYTEAGLIHPVNLPNNGISTNSQTNYAPITAGENQQITNSSRSGILDERKSIYRYTNIENLSTNDDHNRIRLTGNDQRFNIYPKPSSPEQSIFNHKEISRKSLSRKGRSSSEPPVKSIHHSRSDIHLSYDNRSSTIPLPTPVRSLTMVKSNQKLEKLHIDIDTSQATWEPAHDKRKSCDYQFDKDLYLQQKNHLSSSTNLNSPTLYGSSQGSMQDPQKIYPHKSTYSRYSDLKPPIESLTFGGSSENGSYDHISNFSSNGYDNRSNRDTTDHIIDNDLSKQPNRIDDDVSRQQQNRIDDDNRN